MPFWYKQVTVTNYFPANDLEKSFSPSFLLRAGLPYIW